MPATLPITRMWTVPAAGKNTLWEIVNNSNYIWFTYISIRANRNNASDITWHDKNGQTGGFMGPGEAVLVGDEYGSSQMKDFTFVGAEGDTMYMTIGVSLGNTVVG